MDVHHLLGVHPLVNVSLVLVDLPLRYLELLSLVNLLKLVSVNLLSRYLLNLYLLKLLVTMNGLKLGVLVFFGFCFVRRLHY